MTCGLGKREKTWENHDQKSGTSLENTSPPTCSPNSPAKLLQIRREGRLRKAILGGHQGRGIHRAQQRHGAAQFEAARHAVGHGDELRGLGCALQGIVHALLLEGTEVIFLREALIYRKKDGPNGVLWR